MEQVTTHINSLVFKSTRFLIKYVYKWVFPALVTFISILFTDKDNNVAVLFLVWLFHFAAYISIPLNFEKPNLAKLSYYIKNNLLSAIFVLFQAGCLSFGLFILTLVLIIWYLPQFAMYSIVFSVFNSTLYFITIVLASYVVAKTIQN